MNCYIKSLRLKLIFRFWDAIDWILWLSIILYFSFLLTYVVKGPFLLVFLRFTPWFWQIIKWVYCTEVVLAVEVWMIENGIAEVLYSVCQVVCRSAPNREVIEAQGSLFIALDVLNYSSLNCKIVCFAFIYVISNFLILWLTDVLESNGLWHFVYLCQCL